MQEYRGMRETEGQRVGFRKSEGLFSKFTTRRGTGLYRLSDLWSTTQIKNSEWARGTWAPDRWTQGKARHRRIGPTSQRVGWVAWV
jgi:hypothetical protein